jgi:hypothetical protein
MKKVVKKLGGFFCFFQHEMAKVMLNIYAIAQ